MIDELWDKIIEFNDKYVKDWRKKETLTSLSNAVASEVGEVCNLTRKIERGNITGKRIPEEAMKSLVAFEAFDVLVYLVMLLEKAGVDKGMFITYGKDKLNILKMRVKNEF